MIWKCWWLNQYFSALPHFAMGFPWLFFALFGVCRRQPWPSCASWPLCCPSVAWVKAYFWPEHQSCWFLFLFVDLFGFNWIWLVTLYTGVCSCLQWALMLPALVKTLFIAPFLAWINLQVLTVMLLGQVEGNWPHAEGQCWKQVERKLNWLRISLWSYRDRQFQLSFIGSLKRNT